MEFGRAVEVARPCAAQQEARRIVGLDVDVVPVEVELVQVEIAVVKLHVVYLVVYDVQKRALGRVGYDAAPGDEYDAYHQAHDEQHHQREIYGNPCFYRQKAHYSSLSTQPTPRTVWMSFFSKPESTLRRR